MYLDKSKEWHEGYDAFFEGNGSHDYDNPYRKSYHIDHQKALQWELGWNHADLQEYSIIGRVIGY